MTQRLQGFDPPSPYHALRQTASGRKGATRWSIYRGLPKDENYIGDIVHWPENYWSSQPNMPDAEDYIEYGSAELAFKALVRVMCAEPAEYIVMYDTDHEDDEGATRVCRTHVADSIDAHWAKMWNPSTPRPQSQRTLGKIIVSRLNQSAGFFCEADVL